MWRSIQNASRCRGHHLLNPNRVEQSTSTLHPLSSSEAAEDAENEVASGLKESGVESDGGREQNPEAEAVQQAISQIMGSDMAYLLTSEPVTSTSTIPPMLAKQIPPAPGEITLLAALREVEARKQLLQKRCVELQALNILNELYCGKLHGQLAHREETKEKGKGKGKLMGDGLPCMLTDDDFYEKVVVHEDGQKQVAKAKAN